MNAPRHDDRTGDQARGGLMADMLSGIMRLVQGELALFRAETRQRAMAAQSALVLVLLAVVIGITALNVLAGALVMGVAALGLGPHWATLVVGVVLMLVAILLARSALLAVSRATSGPVRMAQSLARDVETLQTMVKRDV